MTRNRVIGLILIILLILGLLALAILACRWSGMSGSGTNSSAPSGKATKTTRPTRTPMPSRTPMPTRTLMPTRTPRNPEIFATIQVASPKSQLMVSFNDPDGVNCHQKESEAGWDSNILKIPTGEIVVFVNGPLDAPVEWAETSGKQMFLVRRESGEICFIRTELVTSLEKIQTLVKPDSSSWGFISFNTSEGVTCHSGLTEEEWKVTTTLPFLSLVQIVNSEGKAPSSWNSGSTGVVLVQPQGMDTNCYVRQEVVLPIGY
jgi:hypothetical protein